MSDDITLVMTCGACPEQYDAVDGKGNKVGYLRLRHGHFTVRYPDVGGLVVYSAGTIGDGVFDDSEREYHLTRAKDALRFAMQGEAAMGVTINQFTTVELPDVGAPLATYDVDKMEYTFWPQGLGTGPSIKMHLSDWHRLLREARLAMAGALAKAQRGEQ